MIYSFDRALELLRKGCGNPVATFRDGQEEAIRHIVEGKGRLLVVQKTGWGKSFVYFIATKLIREKGMGPALLVSPLLSLMRNQIDAAHRMGVRAESLDSDNRDRWSEIEAKIIRKEIDILLISPERFANEHFKSNVLPGIAGHISLFVIDEAHCISDWGHDFRPHYRLIERIIKILPPNLRVLATTATANNRVMQDLVGVLGPDIDISRGDLNRPTLVLQTIKLQHQAERLAWIAQHLNELAGSGIIYTLTIGDAHRISEWLKLKGHIVEPYTGKSGEIRPALERALINNEVKALIATTALGMGFDKPDLSFVIHFQLPGSVVAYYQQVGRAGRSTQSAYGVLLNGQEDRDIINWFIDRAFPTKEEVEAIMNALENNPEGLSIPQLQSEVNISKTRIDNTIALLSLESPAPISKVNTKWQLTASSLSDEFWARAKRLTELRRYEHQEMEEYVELPFGEHMAFLIRALDGNPDSAGRPSLGKLSEQIDEGIVNEAIAFLKRTNIIIEPRKKWPVLHSSHVDFRGNISCELQPKPGRALSVWGDAGWGSLVRAGKYQFGHFPDELVDALVNMISEWNPEPKPEWVTNIPSKRHPRLVADLARRLAQRLKLPYIDLIAKTEDRPEQKTMQNSAQQAANVIGSFSIDGDLVVNSPVYLLDDMVDSKWTFTYAAFLLRKAGSGDVFPIALSKTSKD